MEYGKSPPVPLIGQNNDRPTMTIVFLPAMTFGTFTVGLWEVNYMYYKNKKLPSCSQAPTRLTTFR